MNGQRKNKKLLKLKLQNKNSPIITEKISSYFPIISQESNSSTDTNQTNEINEKPIQTTNKLDLSELDESVFVTKEKPKRQMKLFNSDKNNSTKRKSKKVSSTCDKNVLSRKDSGDVNLDDLQMALAMSNSLKEPGTSPPDSQKLLSLKETLKQFGFNSETTSSKLSTTKLPPQKRKKKRLFKTTLLFRTEEDRKKIIEEKVSQILSNINLYNEHTAKYSKPLEPIETKPSSFVLREIYNSEATTYKKSFQNQKIDKYYNSLVNLENKAKFGSLLKDWHLIPGREKTPPREIKIKLTSPIKEYSNRSQSPDLFSEDEPVLSPDILHFESYNEVNNFDLTHSSDDLQNNDNFIDLTQSENESDNFENNDTIIEDMMHKVINNSQKSLNDFDINQDQNLDLIYDVALLSPNNKTKTNTKNEICNLNCSKITNFEINHSKNNDFSILSPNKNVFEESINNEIFKKTKLQTLLNHDTSELNINHFNITSKNVTDEIIINKTYKYEKTEHKITQDNENRISNELENSRFDVITPDLIDYSLNNENLTSKNTPLIFISDSEEETSPINKNNSETSNNTQNSDHENNFETEIYNDNIKKRNLSGENSLLSQKSSEFLINDEELNYSSYQSAFKKYDISDEDLSDSDSSKSPQNTQIESNISNTDQDQYDLDHIADHLAHENIYNSVENNVEVTPIQNKSVSRLKATENMVVSTPNSGLSSEVVVKTNDVTPMGKYTEMDSPEIQKELDKYGLKQMSRGKSVKILEYLYNATHPICDESSSQNEPATKKRKLEKAKYISNRAVRNRRSQQIVIQKKENPISLNFALNELKPEDMIFERTFSKKMLSCALPFHIAWHNFISTQPALLESILLYEPIWLEDIYLHFKNLGYKYHIQDITTFLDKKCITIRTAQSN